MTAEPKVDEHMIPISIEKGEESMETTAESWSHVVGPLGGHPAVLAVMLRLDGNRKPETAF